MKAFLTSRMLTLVIVFLVAGSSGLLLGQNSNTGEIRGFVTDTSGAAMPDVTVTFANVLTGVSTKVTTNASGTYDAPTLIPGTYSITFSKTGFTSFVKNGVTLGVQVVEEDASLSVGTVTQQITVTAPTPLVQTETVESSTSISSNTVVDLPNVGMTWYNYANLLPGTAPGQVSFNAGGNSMSVNGSAPYTSNWLINGAAAMFTADNNNPDIVGNVPMDSIREVKAETNSYSAAYGNGSSVFNVITKTGTNRWHGSLFETDQNTSFNARNFFEAQTSPVHWNEFGGTIGGPIKRNKAFFFFSYQDERVVTYSPSLTTVPTASEEAGDFSNPAFPTVYDPASLASGVRSPLLNNTISPSQISPLAAKVQQYWPTPNLPGLYNNYFDNLIYAYSTAWYSGTLEYNLSQSNRISVSVMVTPSLIPEPNIVPVASYRDPYLEQQHSISDSWTISPTVVNDFHFGIVRVIEHCKPADSGTNFPSQLGELNPASNLFPSMTISGAISTSIGPGASCVMGQGVYSPSDALTIVRGKHILKMGGEFDRLSDNLSNWGDTNTGNFTFSGIFTRNPANPTSTGLGYADFLYGLPQTWSVTEYPVLGQRGKAAHAFFEDDYKMRRDLTLNLGLRYTILGGWGEVSNRVSDFDPSVTNPATGTPGALWFAGQLGRNTIERTDYHGFQPRLGFAWSPRSNWTVRGAYGVFDQVWAGANYGGGYGQGWDVTGYQTSTDLITPIFSMSPPTASLQAAYPSLAQGPPLPVYPHGTPSAAFLNGQPVSYLPYNAPIPYVQQAHFDVQHQLPGGIFIDAGYIWTRGIHLPFFADSDQVPADLLGPGNAQLRRPYPQYEGLSSNLENGVSNYNGFVFTVKHEFSQGFMFVANYTWSKAMDTQTVSNWTGGDSGLVQYTYNPMANYGLGNADMPNIFNAYAVYQLPVGKGKRFVNQGGILNGVIGGWQLAGVLQVHSGSPFTPTMGTANLSGSLANNWYPNRVANGTVPNPTINEWFNPGAFVEPNAYTFGDSGRNVLLGPSYKDLDISLSKSFPINKLGEGAKFEIKADAVDSLNNPNFGFPNSSIGTFGVGVISSANTSREFQLGAHLTF
jgi:hypothetical protein